MHVRPAKALFYVIMQKVYYLKKVDYTVAMATLKVEISARDKWTAPESFNIIE